MEWQPPFTKGKLVNTHLHTPNWRWHHSYTKYKVGGMIGILRRLKNLIPVNAKLLLYKSAIMLHLTYCQRVWHFCTASYSRKLERLQERALRLVYNTTTESYDTLLKRAKLTTLQNRTFQDILILMFKVKKLTVNQIADIFNTNEENTNSKRYYLRNADFVLPKSQFRPKNLNQKAILAHARAHFSP